MSEFLLGAAAFVVLTVAVGMLRVLRGPGDAERLMAAQLLGTGGVAALLLLGVASGVGSTLDVALTLALLAAFAGFAFVKAQATAEQEDQPDQQGGRQEEQP
ncbi:monovalent cation/H+ antiporter complex subunit F [Paucibacter sp. B2R-40]|uniref:monovalent cation/H+ antiporter complex subunit F n=1 Tax=Paucibacter sp. B2R-40 TaxID=2893554 RepID=UPI0021E45B8B|nr:monovalent cation/H+ antiporter complex subunit F [Paucibacter sp. B2R-40]MCV2353358.1 monovalent cation/H+ antiporter complex subunit F [Paucibacter sp. B2R-40]